MSGEYLLDTNLVIALLRLEEDALSFLTKAKQTYLCSVVVGELRYGALCSANVEPNLEKIRKLETSSTVLACDAGTAERYAELKAELRRQGHPIPENDLWIAALALQHSLTLVTRDAHFAVLPALSRTTWLRDLPPLGGP